jgi:hypothetical protein
MSPQYTGVFDQIHQGKSGTIPFIVRPGVNFVFPTTGTDLRWRAVLHSLSPVRTPWIDALTLFQGGAPGTQAIYLPLIFKNSQ